MEFEKFLGPRKGEGAFSPGLKRLRSEAEY
jgi:hypothetical protein